MLTISLNMPVRGSDGVTVGAVDMLGPPGALTIIRQDPGAHRPHRHVIQLVWIDRVDDAVHLKYNNAELMQLWQHNV